MLHSGRSNRSLVVEELSAQHNLSQNTIMHLMSNATSNTMMTDSDYLPGFDPYAPANPEAYQLANDNSGSVSVSYQQDNQISFDKSKDDSVSEVQMKEMGLSMPA